MEKFVFLFCLLVTVVFQGCNKDATTLGESHTIKTLSHDTCRVVEGVNTFKIGIVKVFSFGEFKTRISVISDSSEILFTLSSKDEVIFLEASEKNRTVINGSEELKTVPEKYPLLKRMFQIGIIEAKKQE